MIQVCKKNENILEHILEELEIDLYSGEKDYVLVIPAREDTLCSTTLLAMRYSTDQKCAEIYTIDDSYGESECYYNDGI